MPSWSSWTCCGRTSAPRPRAAFAEFAGASGATVPALAEPSRRRRAPAVPFGRIRASGCSRRCRSSPPPFSASGWVPRPGRGPRLPPVAPLAWETGAALRLFHPAAASAGLCRSSRAPGPWRWRRPGLGRSPCWSLASPRFGPSAAQPGNRGRVRGVARFRRALQEGVLDFADPSARRHRSGAGQCLVPVPGRSGPAILAPTWPAR